MTAKNAVTYSSLRTAAKKVAVLIPFDKTVAACCIPGIGKSSNKPMKTFAASKPKL